MTQRLAQAGLALLLWLVALSALAAPVDSRVAQVVEALDAWDMPLAEELVQKLMAERPGEPAVYHLLGRIKLHTGDYEEALAAFQQAGVQPGSGGFVDVAARTLELTKNYAQVESEHFIFRYPPGKDEILVPWALETLEAAYHRIGDLVGYKPRGPKILVEVVQNAEELSAVSTLSVEAIKTTGTIAVCKFNKLMVTSPKALARGYEWRDTLAHEYVHLVVTQKSRNHTPIWMHEGIAKYFETAWRGPPGLALELPSQSLLRDAVAADKLITFEQMHPSIALLPTARDAALAFAEVFAAIEYLHGKDPASISTMLAHLGKGMSDRDAVAKVYGRPFAQFEKGWRKHLRSRPYPKDSASPELLKKRFAEDEEQARKAAAGEENRYRDLTELSEFAQIRDARARRAAHLGELLRARGKNAAAAAKYEEAVARAGARFPTLSNKYALALLALNEHRRADEVLRETLVFFPNDPFTNLNLARATMAAGKVKEARPFLISAVSVNPFDPEVQGRLLEVAKAEGDEELARNAARALALLTGQAK